MGSKGSKPRKPSHSQHLPKAGTKPSNDRLLHEERQAVFDTVGLGNASSGMKWVAIIVAVLLFASAIAGLIAWTIL